MTRERHERVGSLFLEVVDLSQDQRNAALDQRCADDPELRAAVESLLAHDERDDALDETALRAGLQFQPSDDERAESLPERIGRYRILRKIGEGGMGIVYEAEQDNPRRTVALKVLRAGSSSRELVRRFRREAHLLGRLHHPGIAHIYEAGVADDGSRRPYLAMELIDGLPLTTFARQLELDIRRRLGLMLAVCDAVQHAHEQGVIHRDLKPGNILVCDTASSHPSVKILDFGIARASDPDVHTVTLHTNPGQLLGTLAYMSPEQVDGSPHQVNARSDVYALGVILYELLGDKLPLEVRDRSIPEAARRIREDEPSMLGSINTAFRGDVETIVAKALEKDPARRYVSAAELAADLRRFLDDQPIQAKPASTLYQLRKFARRHRALVGALAVVLLILSLATVVSVRYAVIASRERGAAQRRAHRANIVAANAEIAEGSPIRARALLEQASAQERSTWEWRYLHARLDSSAHVLRGHSGPVNSLSFSPDGDRLASASDDGTVRIWNVGEGGDGSPPEIQVPLVLRGHTARVARVVFEPSGLRVVSGAADATLRLWDASTGAELDTLSAAGAVSDLDLSKDGVRLVALVRPRGDEEEAVAQPHIQVWNLMSDTLESDWKMPNGQGLASCCFSGDGNEVFLGINTGIQRRTLDGQRVANHFKAHDYSPLHISTSETANLLATCAADKTINLWDATTFTPLRALQGHDGPVRTVAFAPDGNKVASGSDDQTVRIWDVATGDLVHTLLGHAGPVRTVAYSHDGKRLASASDDGTVRLWSVPRIESGAASGVLRGHSGGVYEVACLPDADTVVSAGWSDHTVCFWNPRTGEAVGVMSGLIGGEIDRIAASPDGRHIALCGGQVRLLDVQSGEVTPLGAAGDRTRSAVFNADGTQLITTATKTPRQPRGIVRCWDVASRAMSEQREFEGDVIAASSPGGVRIAVLNREGSRIVDWTTGADLCRFAGQGAKVERLRFSPDGQCFLTASHDSTVGVWDAHTGTQLAVLRGHTEKAYDAIFSPDGTRIATASNDNTIRLWRADTYEELLELRGHERYVFGLAFNMDGTILASASGDGTVRLWRAPWTPAPDSAQAMPAASP